LGEEEDSGAQRRFLLLSEYSVASVFLNDSNRLEEEKIDNFFNDFFFFQLNSELNEKNNNTALSTVVVLPII